MIYQMSQRSPFKPISFVSEAAVLSFITPNMYKILPKTHTDGSEFPISESTSRATIPLEFLCEAVFAGGVSPSFSESTSLSWTGLFLYYWCMVFADGFWGLEAAFGRVDGVVKTATGYCGGTLKKPSYKEVPKEERKISLTLLHILTAQTIFIFTLIYRYVKEEQATLKQ